MKFISLFIQNYGSFYGRHMIPLGDRGLVSVLGQNLDDPTWSRSNGAGKSTWSDALDWCLWGDHPRGDAAASVVNDEAQSGCCVAVQLLDDAGRLIQVRRTRDCPGVPNGPTLSVEGETDSQTALDSRETQRRIEVVLGMDRMVFHAAVLFGQQDGWKFADATDGERKDLLTRMLPELGEVDRLLERCGKMLAGAAEQHRKAASDLEVRTARHITLLSQDPRAQVGAWEQERAGWMTRLQEEVAHWERVLAERTGHLQALGPTQAAPARQPKPAELAEWERRVGELVACEQQALRELEGLRAEAKVAQAQVVRLQDPKALACPTCGRAFDGQAAQHRDQELVAQRAAYDALVARGLQARAAHERVAGERERAQQAAAAGLAAWQRSNEAAAWGEAEELRKANQRAMEEAACREAAGWRDRKAAELEEVARRVNPHLAAVEGWLVAVGEAVQAVRAAERSVAVAARRVAGLEFWERGLGAKGLKSMLLDSRVGEMAQEANRWVQLLTRGTCWVEFSTQREVGKGKQKRLVEDFSIRVFRASPDGSITERGYRSWSGGERYRVALGIDFGLARLVARRARCSYDLMILDEVFGRSLDATGREAVAEMLQALRAEKSTIFVIDHDEQFQHLFGDRMVVQKKRRRSRVLGGLSHGVEPEAAAGGGEGAVQPGRVLATHPAFP